MAPKIAIIYVSSLFPHLHTTHYLSPSMPPLINLSVLHVWARQEDG